MTLYGEYGKGSVVRQCLLCQLLNGARFTGAKDPLVKNMMCIVSSDGDCDSKCKGIAVRMLNAVGPINREVWRRTLQSNAFL